MNYTRNWLKQNPENFPVASRLLPKETRAPILAFYAFARGADEIADDAHIPGSERRHNLVSLERALAAHDEKALPEFAVNYARLAHKHPSLLSCGRDLLSAFVQDTQKARYHNYNDLLDYCQRSAAPVGRAVLTICGETHADLVASDSLCNALQLLNHIQDASDDYVNRDRVYLPLDWFVFAGVDVRALASAETSPSLRRVLDRGLDNCDTLLKRAKPLLATIGHKGVRAEVTFIYELALMLASLLRKYDPLAARVRVGKVATFGCLIKALVAVL